MDLKGKKTTVLGLAREGVALVRYLVEQGARVTVSDSKTSAQLANFLRQIDDLDGVRLSLGQNRIEDTAGADVVFISPGVPLNIPAITATRESGIPMSSQTQLFFELCPAPIIGITGSSGKTTTTALTGEIFKAAGLPTFVGGNIGLPPIAFLSEITPDHRVVLELSSFQLEIMDRSPHIAAITNITPNHLDVHASMDEYIAAKRHILTNQAPSDFAILNWSDPVTQAMAESCPGQVLFFDQHGGFSGDGASIKDEQIIVRRGRNETPVCPVRDILLLGSHNRDNVLTACALASAADVPTEAMASAITSFTGVTHRLEPVAEIEGVRYYNDSIATSPERTVAGLRSFASPIILLAGGRDKHLPLEPMITAIAERCKGVVLFGEMASMLEAALENKELIHDKAELLVIKACSLDEAVNTAHNWASAGDVVLLSPGGTSFDMFIDFEERGEEFKRLVNDLAGKG